ncbi:MAG: superoxide dismutase family protein [Burkholderiaceae bacterium]|nr:MAG: superoxide dismutase family protein [Burkholderiaceae bacterium]
MRTHLPLLTALLIATGCASTPPAKTASAALKPTQGNAVTGTVSFTQKDGQVWMTAEVKGLSPGLHGFHIHEKGDCSAPDGTSAGGHFNPSGHPHGASHAQGGHGGDMGNLTADANGNAHLKLALDGVVIGDGANNIVGRAVIVHAKPDDLTSQPVGNAGARLACGVIVQAP